MKAGFSFIDMKKPSKNNLALRALTVSEEEKRKLTLQEATLIQKSDYSRFSIGGDILSPEELIEYEYNYMIERANR
ncbi:MAG: hypothetical protein EBZ49_08015 [Proteobacteria bacterium]|jgi:hypothetical protein|nr:hypothetical protein [Pseudomonadota bacterium]